MVDKHCEHRWVKADNPCGWVCRRCGYIPYAPLEEAPLVDYKGKPLIRGRFFRLGPYGFVFTFPWEEAPRIYARIYAVRLGQDAYQVTPPWGRTPGFLRVTRQVAKALQRLGKFHKYA